MSFNLPPRPPKKEFKRPNKYIVNGIRGEVTKDARHLTLFAIRSSFLDKEITFGHVKIFAIILLVAIIIENMI